MMKAFGYGVFCTLVLAIAGITGLVASGSLPVAAAKPESTLVAWLLHTAFERRVSREATSIQLPAGLDVPERIQEGARNFASMCSGCHTPPGKEASVVSRGLNPSPPKLVNIKGDHSATELFWVISNGVRMSGMPAFGPTHSEGQIWALVSFIGYAESLDAVGYSQYLLEAREAGHQLMGEGATGDGHHHRHFDEEPAPESDIGATPGSQSENHSGEPEPTAVDDAPERMGTEGGSSDHHDHGEHDHTEHDHSEHDHGDQH